MDNSVRFNDGGNAGSTFSNETRENREPLIRHRDKKGHFQAIEKRDPVVAAKNKACKERLRRERLNECFAKLIKVLDPPVDLRAEKTSIMMDTINYIQQSKIQLEGLRSELRNLKETRSQWEKERRELMYQNEHLKRELQSVQVSMRLSQRCDHVPQKGIQRLSHSMDDIPQLQSNNHDLNMSMMSRQRESPGYPMHAYARANTPMSIPNLGDSWIQPFDPNTGMLEIDLALDNFPLNANNNNLFVSLNSETEESYMSSNL